MNNRLKRPLQTLHKHPDVILMYTGNKDNSTNMPVCQYYNTAGHTA